MPKAFTPEQRKARDENRAYRRRLELQGAWRTLLGRVLALRSQALTDYANASVTARELWLVLAVFELEEFRAHQGDNDTVKSKWMDRIAPRARDDSYGVSGFTSRVAARLPQFLKLSGNGYVYLTDAGYALVRALRERYPQLLPGIGQRSGLQLSPEFTVPSPRWRAWLTPSVRAQAAAA